jgi:enoyl-CoA hydratase
MDFTSIKYDKKGKVGIIRLNRPERMNAVIEEMYREIQRILRALQADDSIRSVIITGSVLKRDNKTKQAFCSGADLKEHASGHRTLAQKREYISLAHETTHMIYEFPKPVIAVVNGPARGAGAEMALNCDFIIMADTASIAFPEVGLGTFIGGGVTLLLPAIIGMVKAKELIYTGKILDGKAALAMGLAIQSVPIDKLEEVALLFASELSEKAPLSLKFAKQRLQNCLFPDMKQVLRHETESILSCMNTWDWHEGIGAFMEKRKPNFKGI